jgi:hypothetical protein
MNRGSTGKGQGQRQGRRAKAREPGKSRGEGQEQGRQARARETDKKTRNTVISAKYIHLFDI